MLQVFRIEHELTRQGPFQTDDVFTQELARKANARPDLKSPYEDGLPLAWLPFSYVFGCLDLKDLAGWFCLGESPAENARIVAELEQRGFRLVEFLVEAEDFKVGRSGTQVAFYPSYSRQEGLTQVHDMESLLA